DKPANKDSTIIQKPVDIVKSKSSSSNIQVQDTVKTNKKTKSVPSQKQIENLSDRESTLDSSSGECYDPKKSCNIKHAYIPYLSSEANYDELKTCIGFVRLTKHQNPAEAAEFLWGKLFKGKPINVFLRKEPTRDISLKNANIVDNNEDLWESKKFNESSYVSNAEELTRKLEEERELRQVAKEKITKLSRENEKKSMECETLEAKVVELSNKIGHLEDEAKLLREDNDKLRNKEAEHLELVNQMIKVMKKF
ncbi:unnamed protein product, partial [Brachionus calyciflorus]